MRIFGEHPIPILLRCRKCGSTYLVICPREPKLKCPECDCRKCPFYPCSMFRPVGEYPIPPPDLLEKIGQVLEE